MLDLPPTALLFAPEASASCDTPWRPLSLHLCPHRGSRLQHAKVTAILYTCEEETHIRLIAGSANLTRRALAGNLEIAAYEDYEIGGRSPSYPSLYELRRLLEDLGRNSTLGSSEACRLLMDRLPERSGRRSSEEFHLVHSSDPNAYRETIRKWLCHEPENASEYAGSVVVSPFFSAQGKKLHVFWRDDLEFGSATEYPVDLIVDGRDVSEDQALHGAEPYSTPPAWLSKYRGDGSRNYRPAIVGQSREDGSARGTGKPGRALHAKMIAVGWARKRARTDRRIWRILLGSSNFTEGGLGLLGGQSNYEASFLVEHEDEHAGQLLGPQPNASALCVEHALAEAAPERKGPDLGASIGAIGRAKEVLRTLDERQIEVQRVPEGGFRVSLDLSGVAAMPDELHYGKEHAFAPAGDGRYTVALETLAPYYIAVRFGEMRLSWPLPLSNAIVEDSLLSSAAARRRVDRLLDFWLRHGGTTVEPDEEDLESDPIFGSIATHHANDEDAPPGSWRLNRLMLGVRRRLAQSRKGTPPRLPAADGLMATIRVRELLAMVSKLPIPDRLYFGSLVRAMLLGYAAGELKPRPALEEAADSEAVGRWRQDELWRDFEGLLETARLDVDKPVLEALDEGADALFASVREAEVVG